MVSRVNIAEDTRMTSRERVIKALNFQPVDRVPKDLGGMASTGISAFAYPRLVKALGLPPRRPKAYDTFQMLALPDMDVLDALGCDAVTISGYATNAFEQKELWKQYDFNGRLDALVRDPASFQNQPDGSIKCGDMLMVPASHVFDLVHGGQPVCWDEDLPKQDLKQLKKDLESSRLKDSEIRDYVTLCKRARESTDKAVFFNGPIGTGLSIGAQGGLGVFPLLCVTEPEYVQEYHEIVCEFSIAKIRALLPEIRPYVDIVMMAADDWGTQSSLMASPAVFRDLFRPYLRRTNDECHKIAPEMKTFLHSCGAIYELIDDIIASGFDILNPVQWTAGGRPYAEWKDKCRNRIALWGGGVNAQKTLPFGSAEEVAKETTEIVSCLKRDSGYVFNSIHNILAEIPPEKIIAMYKAAAAV
jgi:uroporphyrinogen decarboxylase